MFPGEDKAAGQLLQPNEDKAAGQLLQPNEDRPPGGNAQEQAGIVISTPRSALCVQAISTVNCCCQITTAQKLRCDACLMSPSGTVSKAEICCRADSSDGPVPAQPASAGPFLSDDVETVHGQGRIQPPSGAHVQEPMCRSKGEPSAAVPTVSQATGQQPALEHGQGRPQQPLLMSRAGLHHCFLALCNPQLCPWLMVKVEPQDQLFCRGRRSTQQ